MKEAKTKTVAKRLIQHNRQLKGMMDRLYLDMAKLRKEKIILKFELQFSEMDSELQYKVALDPSDNKDWAQVLHVRFTISENDEINRCIIHLQDVVGDSEIIFDVFNQIQLFGKGTE